MQRIFVDGVDRLVCLLGVIRCTRYLLFGIGIGSALPCITTLRVAGFEFGKEMLVDSLSALSAYSDKPSP